MVVNNLIILFADSPEPFEYETYKEYETYSIADVLNDEQQVQNVGVDHWQHQRYIVCHAVTTAVDNCASCHAVSELNDC